MCFLMTKEVINRVEFLYMKYYKMVIEIVWFDFLHRDPITKLNANTAFKLWVN